MRAYLTAQKSFVTFLSNYLRARKSEFTFLSLFLSGFSFLSVFVSIQETTQGTSETLCLRKSIEIRLRLQVVVGCSVLLPLKVDLELQL